MKKQTEQTLKIEEGFDFKVRSRNSKPVTIHIPTDTLASLGKIASERDMSVEALLKLYIGQSMQQDLGFGNYTRDRGKWLPKKSVKEIGKQIVKEQQKSK